MVQRIEESMKENDDSRLLYNFVKQYAEILSAYLAMSHLVFLLPVAILLTMKKKQPNTQSQLPMKTVITEERFIDMY